jgi:hypothetical protein
MMLAALVGGSALALAPAPEAEALSGSEFMPGLIIADSLFYDSNAMSESEIQQFLVSKGSGLAWMTFSVSSRGRSISADTGRLKCDSFTGGTLSAATIIYRAQRSCGISAKVILVTLQKEQGLITKASPTQSALDRAMGYACPDTAPCAPTTLGFGNQVYSGALQLNTYRASAFGRQPGWHTIQYHPNASCGGSSVLIQNHATAALYNYTPYQPNSAALATLYGTGNGCSSYGNRNFWVYYSTWFGSTLGVSEPFPVIPPVVAGSSMIGATLTAQPGTWTGEPNYAYSWLRCGDAPRVPFSAVPAGCTVLDGQTSQGYETTRADRGAFIAVLVTATNGYGATVSGGVSAARVGTPVNLSVPTVTGSPKAGSLWTLDVGQWVGDPAPTLAIFWLRCTHPVAAVYTTVPVGCAVIDDARGTTYRATPADIGTYLTAQVAGNSPLGFSLAGAVSTIPIGFPVNDTPPSISGSEAVGSTWRLDPGVWSGSPAPSLAIYWLRCDHPITTGYTTVPVGCAVITGANGTSYTSTSSDVGKYLTAQVAGNSSRGFALAGALNSKAIVTTLPVNTVAPTVTGADSVGSTWTVKVGTWTGAPAPTLVVYWLRCNQPITSGYTTVPAGCAAIPGANAMNYVATSGDVGKYLTAQVAGNSPIGFSLAGAVNRTAIKAPELIVPTNTTPPTVSGSASAGSTWTVDVGTWTGSPSIAIYWLRCNQPITSGYTTVPAGCAAIPGANAINYVATSGDVGKYLTAQVAGNSPIGFSLAGAVNGTMIEAVPAKVPANVVPPTLSGSTAAGSLWMVDPGVWTENPAIAIHWLRCGEAIVSTYSTVPRGCVAIPGATQPTYTSSTADIGKYLTAQVAGNSTAGFTIVGTLNDAAIAPATAGVPTNLVLPVVSGAPEVGSRWTVNTGIWTGAPTMFVAWLRCEHPITSSFTTVPEGCTAIAGANERSYVAAAADIGRYVTAQVAGNAPAGFSLAGAVSSTPVQP